MFFKKKQVIVDQAQKDRERQLLIDAANASYARRRDQEFQNCITKHYGLTIAAMLTHIDKYDGQSIAIYAMKAAKEMAAYEFRLSEFFTEGKCFHEWFQIIEEYNQVNHQRLRLFQTLLLKDSDSKEDFNSLVEFSNE